MSTCAGESNALSQAAFRHSSTILTICFSFDSELSAAQEEASRSKDLQEQLSRKKEMELVSKHSLEKQLEDEIADRKRIERELRQLKEELETASSLGSMEEREVSRLRLLFLRIRWQFETGDVVMCLCFVYGAFSLGFREGQGVM